jgi:hypothetical protein
MKYNRMTRRMFLQGSGKSFLAMPFLASMLPRELWAQSCGSPPVRFVMCASQWSSTPQMFSGSLVATDRRAPNVAVRSLQGLSNISDIIGSDFNNLLRKMSILRGIDNLGPRDVSGHDFSMGSTGVPTGWWYNEIDAGKCTSGNRDCHVIVNKSDFFIPPVINTSSIDVILSQSAKVYPNTIASNRRLFSLIPINWGIHDWGHETNGTWRKSPSIFDDKDNPTYDRAQANANDIRFFDSSRDLRNLFLSEFTGGSMNTTPPPATTTSDKDVVQAVFDDFKRVHNSNQISTEDKSNLSNYMDLINEVLKGLNSTKPPTSLTCENPSIGDDGVRFERWKNYVNIITAAMHCDLTRVVNLHLNSLESPPSSVSEGQVHDYHHTLGTGNANPSPEVRDYFRNQWINAGRKFAYLLSRMDSLTDSNGLKLLDNSVVYWWQQHGLAQSCDATHVDGDKGIIIAGGGGGALEMGYFIDYRHSSERWGTNYRLPGTPGIPVNVLLSTLCHTFGLTPAEYQIPGKVGFGTYTNDRYRNETGGWMWAMQQMSASYRNQILAMRTGNLPFLFKRAIC